MKTKEKAVIKQRIIPELVSGSSTQAVTQQQALKTLKKFQGLYYFTTAPGFTHRAYRLGVSPTGAASKLWDTCHKNGDLSGSHPTYKLTYKKESLNKGSFRAPLRSGFTLIELLVVVLIIGILAAVSLPQYQKAVLKSRFTQAKILVQSLSQAQERFYLANGIYTTNIDELDIDFPNVQRTETNQNQKTYYFLWGYCLMDIDNAFIKCGIFQNENEIITLQQNSRNSRSDPEKKKCITSATNYSTIANEICKQETNATPYQSDRNKFWVYNY